MLIIYQGRAGDRNGRAMAGSALLGNAIAARMAVGHHLIGHPQLPLRQTWDAELAAARPELTQLASTYHHLLLTRSRPVAVIGRCAAALATLPVVVQHRPQTCVVWFDAHADSNTPLQLQIRISVAWC